MHVNSLILYFTYSYIVISLSIANLVMLYVAYDFYRPETLKYIVDKTLKCHRRCLSEAHTPRLDCDSLPYIANVI